MKIEHIGNHVRLYLGQILKKIWILKSHPPLGLPHWPPDARRKLTSLPSKSLSAAKTSWSIASPSPTPFSPAKTTTKRSPNTEKSPTPSPAVPKDVRRPSAPASPCSKKASEERLKNRRETLYAEAHDEFEKLHTTPSAPLEYLGKSLVYKAQEEFEEAKCLELALRKFPTHPLRPVLIENILSRLHEASQKNRQVAYRFALIVLRHLSQLPEATDIATILEQNLEPLPFSPIHRSQHLPDDPTGLLA